MFYGHNIMVILLLVPMVFCSHSPIVTTVMESTATFTDVMICPGEKNWTVKKNDGYHHVTTCKEKNCTVEPRFKNRVKQQGTNFTISPVLFNDNGFYIYSCNDQEICSFILRIESRTTTAFITAGGNVTTPLCSMDQVKLNYTPVGSSAAETKFIVDNSKVFIDSQASGTMRLSVQNNTAVLSGVTESGLVTGLDSRTGTKLFEVNVTVTGPVDQSTWTGDICLPLVWWISIPFLLVLLLGGIIFLWHKLCRRVESNQHEEMPALALAPMLGDRV